MPERVLTYRLASEEDCSLFFEWANDESVRGNSFSPARIAWEDHLAWFRRKLDSGKSFLFIFFLGADAVGQLRLDLDNGFLEIDYSIDKKWRGQKIGQQVLKEARLIAKKFFPGASLKGIVQQTNAPSAKAFESAGYIKHHEVVMQGTCCLVYYSD